MFLSVRLGATRLARAVRLGTDIVGVRRGADAAFARPLTDSGDLWVRWPWNGYQGAEGPHELVQVRAAGSGHQGRVRRIERAVADPLLKRDIQLEPGALGDLWGRQSAKPSDWIRLSDLRRQLPEPKAGRATRSTRIRNRARPRASGRVSKHASLRKKGTSVPVLFRGRTTDWFDSGWVYDVVFYCGTPHVLCLHLSGHEVVVGGIGHLRLNDVPMFARPSVRVT